METEDLGYKEINCRQRLVIKWLDAYPNIYRMTDWELELVTTLKDEIRISKKQSKKLEEIYKKFRHPDTRIKFEHRKTSHVYC